MEHPETSICCCQVGPVVIRAKFEQGHAVYRERRFPFFKKMQIVRGCDVKRNVLVYLTHTDKIIEGSPQNSNSSVPITPWGTAPAPKCAKFVEE
jgi:CreA protein